MRCSLRLLREGPQKVPQIKRLCCQSNNAENPPGTEWGLSVKAIHTSVIMALCPVLRILIKGILWLLVQDSFFTLSVMMVPGFTTDVVGGASTVIARSSWELDVIF